MAQQYHAELSPVSQENVERVQILNEFDGKKGLFLKAFFLDSKLNANMWQVTDDAIDRGLRSAMDKSRFHGRTSPIILLEPGNIYGNDFGHPPEELLMTEAQEPFRVGDAVEFGRDKNTSRAFGVYHLDEAQAKTEKDKARIRMAIEMINDRTLAYVSPSIKATQEMHSGNGKILVTEFLINHLALVKNPAYGEHKAQVRGVCNGDGKECLKQLSNVQASVKIKQAHVHDATCQKGKDGKLICVDDLSTNPQAMFAQCGVTNDIYMQANGQNVNVTKYLEATKQLQGAFPDLKELEVIADSLDKLNVEEETPSKESLKTKNNEDILMADKTEEELQKEQQAKKAEEELNKEKTDQVEKEVVAKKANEEVVKKLEEQDKEIQALKQARQAEVIKPMAERVASAKVTIGSLKSESLQAEIAELVQLPENALAKLDTEYQAMVEKVNAQANTPSAVRYDYQANEGGKLGEELLKSIRSRMS